MDFTQSITKKDLCNKYSISSKVLREYMNQHFFEELEAVGYKTSQRILPPNVVRKFVELFGKPISKDEL